MWLERVREWEKSGQPADQFVEGKPYMASTLLWRSRQLHRLIRRENAEQSRNRRAPGRVSRRPKAKSTNLAQRLAPNPPTIAMAEVVRRPTVKVDTAVILEFGGVHIRVVPGFDAVLLNAVIRALQGAE